MAFSCTYDNAVTNVGVDPNTPVELSDASALVNAANELKAYLNNQGGFNEHIITNVAWGGDPNVIDSDLVISLRTMLEEIDPTLTCSCNYVCSNDNECTCNSQGNTCTCVSESHCSGVCGCDYDCSCDHYCVCDTEGTNCTCVAEEHCYTVCACDYDCSCNNNCACDIVYTT